MKLNPEGRKWMPLWAVLWVDVYGEWHTAKIHARSWSEAADRLGRLYPVKVQGIDCRYQNLVEEA